MLQEGGATLSRLQDELCRAEQQETAAASEVRGASDTVTTLRSRAALLETSVADDRKLLADKLDKLEKVIILEFKFK